ncbi:MAG: BREX system P-loop protein BrxC [Chthoniobacteraceae bacterium]
MKIHELFVKPVERPIEGVIKADDDRHLQTEVEEYVVTGEISKGLELFAERYLQETNANGVWISGFFGSGKSHLLKILSLLLENRPLPDGRVPADYILPKIEDEIVQGDLRRSVAIPSKSLLFNIDQKADAIGGDHSSPILEVFVKVLNELQGYYAKQGHIAEFECDLESRGELERFKETYARISGRSWEADLPVIESLENETFAKAYAEHSGTSYDEALRLFDRKRESYKVSIETFAKRVKAYIDKQTPGFRLNFFVDEVGQFIGQDSKHMLNLQTVAETLATVCQGRAWVFVTSQGDLQKVLGGLWKEEGQDFTKIEARFKTRLTLTSADVREVIQKRLLAKTEAEPEALTNIYDTEEENLRTLYRFGAGSVEYKGWRGSDEFCGFYPFHLYQFDLFQRAIERLSQHDAFTGKHTAVGERSMLAVFQEVAKKLRDLEVGRLATFDLMFDGIAASLRGDIQTSVRQAERQLDSDLAIRILKALFLLKWVREFKATPRNVAILLIDRPDLEIAAHEKAVKEALNLLEAQSYLQRNGEVFEFLTDTEKDIEVEIKNTELDDSQFTKLLGDILFADVLRDPKIRFEGNAQDYTYARRLDDQLIGKDADISINVITAEHPNHSDINTLAAQNTGKAELLAVLPADLRALDDARLYLKTQKYIQQNTGAGLDETRRSILTERGQQNSTRRTALQARCAELLSKAPLYLNASRLDSIGEGEPRNRYSKAAQELIRFAYPNLRMLRGNYDESTLSKTLLDPSDLLEGADGVISEAEQEILTYVTRNQNSGERVSVDAIIREFGKRPSGWYPMAVLTLIARLFRMGKVELRSADLLDARAALEALKNSRQHGSVRVRLQEQFDAAKVAALKRFHQEFFDRSNDASDARSVAQLTSEALAGEGRDLRVLLDQSSRYPFLKTLEPVAAQLEMLAGKDYSYLLNHLAEFGNRLLDAKEDVLDPMKTFMHGPQRVAYDEATAFFREEEANFAEVPEEEIAPLRALATSATPFRGTVVPTAKAAVTRLRGILDEKLAAERERGFETMDEHETKLRALDDFKKINESAKAQVLEKSGDARQFLQSARFVSAIRDRIIRYTTQDYPAQLALATRLVTPRISAKETLPGDRNRDRDPDEPVYLPASKLKAACDLPFIATEADLDVWLTALRQAALEEIHNGNRISL